MMAGLKHFRYLAALPDGRPSIVRKFQKPLREGFLLGGLVIPKHAGYKADRRINQGGCSDLATGQDEIAKADLLDPVMVENALVYALETTAKQGDAVSGGKAAGGGLIEGFSTR